MNEEKPKDAEHSGYSLLAEDFVYFLKKKTPSAHCPFCKQGTFDVLTKDDMMLAIGVTLAEDSSKMLPALPAICSNCGYIRLHSYNLVKRSLPALRKADEQEGAGDGQS